MTTPTNGNENSGGLYGAYTTKITKSKKVGADGNARDVLSLYFKPDTLAAMIARLGTLSGTERGVKITIHTGKKVSEEGRQFDSSFMFIDEIQPRVDGGGANRGFVPKVDSAETKAAAAQTLNTKVE